MIHQKSGWFEKTEWFGIIYRRGTYWYISWIPSFWWTDFEEDINNCKHIWVFPTIGVLQNGWFIMENPMKMDDLRVPLFLETPIYLYTYKDSLTCDFYIASNMFLWHMQFYDIPSYLPLEATILMLPLCSTKATDQRLLKPPRPTVKDQGDHGKYHTNRNNFIHPWRLAAGI